MSIGLLLIDIQNDYFPGGKMELQGSLLAVTKAAEVLALFRKCELPIFHVRHDSVNEGATFFLPGTTGAEIHGDVLPVADEVIVTKQYPNSFRGTDLLDHLKSAGVTKLVVAGMMTHMCVDAGVRAAVDLGFECMVLSDATATRALPFGDAEIPAAHVHGAFLAALGMAYATVITAGEVEGML